MLAFASLLLLAPFATGALLGSWPGARRLAGRYYAALVTLGVGGLALVVLGAFVLPQPVSLIALGIGGPLSGLSFWARRSDGEDDGPGGGGDDDDPEPPPPGGDWERIVRDFERYVDRHNGPIKPGHDRSPEPSAPVSPALV
ncbi:MAG TPA: hypothetical protein VGI67_10875 [Thermoleophilaceae bacterium]